MLELLIVVVRAFMLAPRGHRELILENLALRQQLAAFHRTTRCRLRACDRLFWVALARSWRNWSTALNCRATGYRHPLASRLASPPLDATPRDSELMAVHQLISRSAPSFARWRPRTHYGAHRGFTANCHRSASTSLSGRFHVCWNRTHARRRRRGRRFSRITSHPPRRWISSPCRHSPVACCSC